jgi:hypothetical protein
VSLTFDFLPDPCRAEMLDRRMHRELGLSLQHICEASRGIIPFDEGRAARLIARLTERSAFAPAVFAQYYELVEAILTEDRAGAERLFAELVAAQPFSSGMQVVDFGDPELGSDNQRYAVMFNSDSSLDLGFMPTTPELATAFRMRLAAGLSLLHRALPALAGEIQAIVRQIVIAGSDPAKALQFDGGSHYKLWGALFLNANYHPNPVAVAEVLAHESAHSLLFGFCTDEALVLNEDAELFDSPLRSDKRPMDGIYHATFVSARMHWTMSQLAQSEILSADEQDAARAAAATDLANFDAGYEVVREHGVLTGLGRSLMACAKEYVDDVR